MRSTDVNAVAICRAPEMRATDDEKETARMRRRRYERFGVFMQNWFSRRRIYEKFDYNQDLKALVAA